MTEDKQNQSGSNSDDSEVTWKLPPREVTLKLNQEELNETAAASPQNGEGSANVHPGNGLGVGTNAPAMRPSLEVTRPVLTPDGSLGSVRNETTPRARFERPEAGDRFAERYEILTVLGKGGMSTVYKAYDEKLNRIVALKLVHPHLVDQEDCVKRFEREARSVGGLKHDHIVEIYTSDVTDTGYPYIVMEYLEGQAMSSLIKHVGRIPYNRAVVIFMQIADALAHAHAKGVIHRDLKPSNVLLSTIDGADSVGVVDFGLAKFMPHSRKDDKSITATGEVFGSPPYMSPEQCVGKTIDERSDIYSLGCLMYEALTGEPPFVADTPVATVMKHIGEIPQPLGKLAPGANIPPLLEALILKALDKDPKSRQQSMDELLNELKTLVSLEQAGMEFKPVNTGVKLRMLWTQNRTVFILSTIIGLGLIAWAYWVLSGWIDSYYEYEYRWLKIATCWIMGIAALFGAWRLRKLIKEITSPEIAAIVPQVSWHEAVPPSTAEIEQIKLKLNGLPQLLDNSAACSNRAVQQQIRDAFQFLLAERLYDDVEKYTTQALEILRTSQRDNLEVALLFREFLTDAKKARGAADSSDVSYREIMNSWQSSDDFSRHVKSTVQLKLADSLRAQRKYSEAQAIYSISLPTIASHPYSSVHYGRLGDCYLSMGNLKLASEQYQKAMSVAEATSDKVNSELGFIKYAYICHKRWKPLDVKRDFAKSVATIDDAFGRNSSHYFVAMSVYATEMWKSKRFIAALNAHKEATAKIPMISAAS